MKNIALILLAAILGLQACKSVKNTNQYESDITALYRSSITDSRSPSPEKVYSKLIAVIPQNEDLIWKTIEGEQHVLVVTWKQHVSYYQPYVDTVYNTGPYPIWVTTAPELLKKMKSENIGDSNLRLKQLLGLPPITEYHYFVEMWVRPEDLFRPCPDSEVSDSRCDLCFPADADDAHISWINAYRINSYYQCELFDNYPWTQLGYTYDWNASNSSHIGLSEFVIAENKDVYIHAIYSTNEYLSKR